MSALPSSLVAEIEEFIANPSDKTLAAARQELKAAQALGADAWCNSEFVRLMLKVAENPAAMDFISREGGRL